MLSAELTLGLWVPAELTEGLVGMLADGHPQVVIFVRPAFSALSHFNEVKLRSVFCQGSGVLLCPCPKPFSPAGC